MTFSAQADSGSNEYIKFKSSEESCFNVGAVYSFQINRKVSKQYLSLGQHYALHP